MSVPSIDPPASCSYQGACPICKTPCPGVCLFADGLDSMQIMIIVMDLATRHVVYENQAASRFLDTIGDHSFDGLNVLLMRDGRSFDALLEDPGQGKGMEDEVRYSDFSLQRLSIRVDSRIYGYSFYRSKGIVWVFLRDITERSRLEAIAASVEQMNSLGFIFSAVRHELGNPIHSIKSAVSVLRSGLDRMSRQTVADYLKSIEMELSRTESLLRSLKNFSLFETPELKALDLTAFFGQLKPLICPDLEARGIELRIDTSGGAPLVSADARALNQIMINLVANAADDLAGQPGSRILVRVVPGDGQVAVTVEDNGPGIPGHLLERAFTPFFTTKEHGTGLGLVIVKKLVTGMNGTIWMEQVVPHGVRVVFTLGYG